MKYAHFHHTIIFLLFLAGCNRASNQSVSDVYTQFTSRTDSLEWVAGNKQLPSSNRMNAYYELAIAYRNSDYQKALENARLGAMLAKVSKDVKMEGHMYYQMGVAYWTIGATDSAFKYINITIDWAQKIKDRGLEAKGDNVKSILYKEKNMHEKALEYAFKVLAYYEEVNHTDGISAMLLNIGNIYCDVLNGELALQYYQRYEKMAAQAGNREKLASVYANYVEIYLWNEDIPTALEYALKAVEMFRELSLPYELSFALEDLALVYSAMGEHQNQLKCSEECLQIAEEFGMESRILWALNSLSLAHFDLGHYAKSEATALRALETDSELGKMKRSLLWTIAKDNVMMNNHTKALEYLSKYDDHLFSYLQDDYREKASELQIKYETEKKELEIERQQTIISKQNLQRTLLAGGVAMSVVILVLLWYLLHLRNRRNSALTERNTILAEMNATKDKFFSIISHDLKNPALAQRDALLLLVKNAQTWDTDTLTEYYNELLKSAEGEVELIYHLLNWAQLQTGRMSYTPSTFNLLARLLPDLSLIRKMADNKQITFHSNIPDDLFLTADSDMITTTIRNLLTNAIKFTSTPGEVSLSIEPSTGAFRQAQCDHTPLAHKISISDTGTGIPPAQLRTLFSLDRPKGMATDHNTGLGLIVCKELLEKHGTTLHVQSEVGKGSTFWFTI